MNERVAALLAHRSVREVLEESDLVDVLGDVVPMSEDYIPVLQFLMRPDNCTLLAGRQVCLCLYLTVYFCGLPQWLRSSRA